MASKNRPPVSISGDLHSRLRSACVPNGMAGVVDAIVWRSLDEFEADPAKAAAFCAMLVKAAPPSSTIRSQPRKVYLPQAVWYRLYRARKAAGFPMSNVAMNSEMVEAMLDAAGAK
jgi:hypothetical protein